MIVIEIKGTRGSGKTTKLLYLALGSGAIIIEPTYAMAEFVKNDAKKLGLANVTVISMNELLDPVASAQYKNNKFLIDEIDIFLENLNVEGYTKTV